MVMFRYYLLGATLRRQAGYTLGFATPISSFALLLRQLCQTGSNVLTANIGRALNYTHIVLWTNFMSNKDTCIQRSVFFSVGL